MLKFVPYRMSFGKDVGVAYALFNKNTCVFTATEKASLGSTINYAEAIALAIAKEENRDVSDLRFFDLQTRTSYGSGMWKPEPGYFEFEEVVLVPDKCRLGGIQAKEWLLAECPEYVTELFSAYIDGEPRQILMRPTESSL